MLINLSSLLELGDEILHDDTQKFIKQHLPFLFLSSQLCSKPAAWFSTPSSSLRASTWGSTTSSTGATAWPGVGPSFPSVEGSSTASTPRITRSFTRYDLSPRSYTICRGTEHSEVQRTPPRCIYFFVVVVFSHTPWLCLGVEVSLVHS